MKRIRKLCHKIELEYYQGTLDYPCDFCKGNYYKNFQLNMDDDLKFVVCEECLNKVKRLAEIKSKTNKE